MSHCRFALGFPRHKKVRRLSDAAVLLWVMAMHHAREQGTDGFLDDVELDDVPRCPKRGAKRKALVTELVTARLWDEVDGGWQIHDYPDWQDSAELVKAKRDAACERARAYRKRKAERDAARAADVTHNVTENVHREGEEEISSSSSNSGSESESREGDARGDRARGQRPKPRPDLLRQRILAHDFTPLPAHWEYAQERGLDRVGYDRALRDLRDKCGQKLHDLPWLDDKFSTYIETAAQPKPVRAVSGGSRAQSQLNDQLEHIADLEAQEAAGT